MNTETANFEEFLEHLPPQMRLVLDLLDQLVKTLQIDGYSIVMSDDGMLTATSGGCDEDFRDFMEAVNDQMADKIDGLLTLHYLKPGKPS